MVAGVVLLLVRVHDDTASSVYQASRAQAAAVHLRHQGEVSTAQRLALSRLSYQGMCFK